MLRYAEPVIFATSRKRTPRGLPMRNDRQSLPSTSRERSGRVDALSARLPSGLAFFCADCFASLASVDFGALASSSFHPCARGSPVAVLASLLSRCRLIFVRFAVTHACTPSASRGCVGVNSREHQSSASGSMTSSFPIGSATVSGTPNWLVWPKGSRAVVPMRI